MTVKTVGGIHAGRIFTISSRVFSRVGAVSVTGFITLWGRALPAVAHYSAHVATCQGIAPPGSAGKRLAGVLAVTIRGDRDARAFTLVIRP